MSFKWSCFIVPLRLEICLFIAILVCLSLFYSVYVQTKVGGREEEERKKEIYIYIYTHVYVFSISIP